MNIDLVSQMVTMMDEVFLYKIGTFLQLRALGEKVDGPTFQGYGSRTDKDKKRNSWIDLQFSDPKVIYQVVERLLQQCHGGVQKHYVVRMMASNGSAERQCMQFTEDELVPANVFRRSLELTKSEVLEYANNVLKDDEGE